MKALRFILFLLSLLPLSEIQAAEINTPFFGNLALKGHDPVAYFTQSKPVKGKKEFQTEWKGATWCFANEEHLNLFSKNPQKYAPQYGGYCAWAVSQGKTADIDPRQWAIEDGKLYLNYNHDIQEKWLKEKTILIRLADQRWPELKD